MKAITTLLAVFLAVSPIFAQDTLKTYWNNQQLKSIGVANDSIEEGVWRYYHPDGRLMMEGKYLHGKKVGLWKAWYESGKLSRSIIPTMVPSKAGIPAAFWSRKGR